MAATERQTESISECSYSPKTIQMIYDTINKAEN